MLGIPDIEVCADKIHIPDITNRVRGF